MGGVGDLSVVLGRKVVLLGPPQAQPCQVVSPADSGGGARLSPEKAGEKSAGGCAPWTPGFITARSHSLVFGIVIPGTIVRLFPPVS